MDLENKRLYHWLPWFLGLVVLSLFLVLLRNELARQDSEWQQRMAIQQASLQSGLLITQQDLTRQATLLAQLVAQDSAIINTIREAYKQHQKEGGADGEQAARLRDQLYKLLQPYWDRMEPAGVHELNVHFAPNATVFIRASRPDRFGDDLGPIRPMLLDVLRNGTSRTGMEVGHYGSSYRAVMPVFTSDQPDTAAIATIEVGLGLLPPRAGEVSSHGQAILLHPTLVNELLWGAALTGVRANTGNERNHWGLESFTHPIIKEWQIKGMIPEPLMVRDMPWVLTDQGKSYLLCINRLADYSGQHAPLMAPKVLVLTWEDITDEIAHREALSSATKVKYLIECLIAELTLWLLFRYNRRHVLNLLRAHSYQLQKERDLSEHSRQRLNLALVSSESGFWEWDVAHNRAKFSKEWRELCGLPTDDNEGADIEEWLGRVHPADKRSSYAEMIRHIKGETPMFENEYRLRIADGSYKWIFTRGKVAEWTADGKAALMLGVYTDITERKKNEVFVIRQQAALHALNEIASMPVLDAEDQLRRALAVGARYLGLPVGIVSHILANQYHIKVQVGPRLPGPANNVDALFNRLCEKTYRSEEVFALDDVGKSDYATHPAHIEGRIESYIGVPIWLKGVVYGTLCFVSERSRHQGYDDLDKDFMRLLARWVGVTLERWQYQVEQQALIDRFAKLCNQLPGFLYQFHLRPDGTSFCPYASAGIEELYGVRPEEVMASADKLFAILHPDDLGWISETVSLSATHQTPWIATFRIINPNRGERWVHAESRPELLADGGVLWHGFIVDITEEKQAELRLQEVNALREAIFDAASISIISTDKNGLIKTFNRGAEKMLGYSAGEMININTPSVLHLPEEVIRRAVALSHEFGWEIKSGFDVFIARAREGGEDENEWTYVRKDGSHFPILLSVTALRDLEGEITGYLGLGRDISELKRIDQMKTEFISTVSHELRTPLTAISGALGIIMSGAAGALPDTAAKMLNIAHKNSLRLIHLVNDLLDMEKLVAGKMHFDMHAQSLLAIVQQSVEANSAYAAQYHVKYVVSNREESDIRITVDAQRLQQVLANFLSNAAKFSPQNDVVDIIIEKKFNHARVTVVDKGPGIPDEFRSRIFQKFSQADSSDTRQKSGTGLGLAICKEMIERMGGTVGFHSQPGQGARFYFEMPCEETHSHFLDKSDPRIPTGNRLLVIEDDPEVAELLATILRNQNYRVDIAYSGQTAMERIALYAYQAVTIDLKLPDIDGVKLIRQLRTDSSTHQMPIIVISAHLDDQFAAVKNDPVFANIKWLEKPLNTEDLISAIQAAVAVPVLAQVSP